MLQEEGLNGTQAMEVLQGLSESEIHEFVFQKGINLAKTPTWERRGVMVYRKNGRMVVDWDIPLFSSKEGKALLADIIGSAK